MANVSTPTGQKAQAAKKSYSEYVGVDVFAAGLGFADDLAAAAESRRARKGQTAVPAATTNPKA